MVGRRLRGRVGVSGVVLSQHPCRLPASPGVSFSVSRHLSQSRHPSRHAMSSRRSKFLFLCFFSGMRRHLQKHPLLPRQIPLTSVHVSIALPVTGGRRHYWCDLSSHLSLLAGGLAPLRYRTVPEKAQIPDQTQVPSGRKREAMGNQRSRPFMWGCTVLWQLPGLFQLRDGMPQAGRLSNDRP